MDFKIDKKDGYTLVQVLKDKLDTHIAPALKSELVLISGNGEKNIPAKDRNAEMLNDHFNMN